MLRKDTHTHTHTNPEQETVIDRASVKFVKSAHEKALLRT